MNCRLTADQGCSAPTAPGTAYRGGPFVELATQIHLTINLKTAKALGIKILRSLLARADELIQ